MLMEQHLQIMATTEEKESQKLLQIIASKIGAVVVEEVQVPSVEMQRFLDSVLLHQMVYQETVELELLIQ